MSEELRTELSKVHQLLEQVPEVDADTRASLTQVLADIQHALDKEQSHEIEPLRERVNALALTAETEHPHLTDMLSRIVNLLSGLGI